MRRSPSRPSPFAGLFGLVFVLFSTNSVPAADEAPLARYVPRQDLVALVEYDGLDAHEAAWKKTAASKLLNETKLGSLLEDIAAQGFEKMLATAPPDGKPKGTELVAVIEELAEKGIVFGVIGKPPGEPGFVLAVRGGAKGKIRAFFDVAKRVAAPDEVKSGKRSLTKIGPGSVWFEGDDLIFANSEALTGLVIGVIDSKAPNATSHAIRAEIARPEKDFTTVFRAFVDPSMLPQLPPQGRALGFDGIKRVDARWGFQGDALMSVVRLLAPKPRRAALALFDQPTLTRASMPPLPADLHGFTVFSADPEVVFGRMINLMAISDRTVPEKAARFEAQFQQATGLGLREDLLKQLGPKMAIYLREGKGGQAIPLGPGMIARIPEITILAQVDSPVDFGKSIDRLMNFANKLLESERARNPNAPAIEIKKIDGPSTAYTLELPPGALPFPGFEPTLFVTKGYAILSTSNASANQAAKLVSGGGKPWTPAGPFAAMADQLPSGIIFLNVNDPRDSFPQFVTSLPSIVQTLDAIVGQAPGRAADGPLLVIDPAKIPTEQAMSDLLFPGFLAVAVDDQSIRLVSRSSFPSVSSPASSGVLIALLLPAVQSAREAARRTQCVNNLKQIGLAMVNYHSANDTFPAANIMSKDGKPLLSWRVAILPFLEQGELYNKFHLDEPWDSPNNKPLIAEMPNMYACPSDIKGSGMTTYRVFVGGGAAFEATKATGIRDFLDGTSNTILVTESKDAVTWTQPGNDIPFVANPNVLVKGPSSNHPGGANALFADGSVHFLKSTIHPTTLRALITRAGGEVINPNGF